MSTVSRLVGQYVGSGTWHDSAGKSGSYQITQSIDETPNGFGVSFKHRFEDSSVVEATFDMHWVASRLFAVHVAGRPVGEGYWLGDYCHYRFQSDDRLVEAGYLVHGDGLRTYGSSSKNAQGNYIAWHEELHRRGSVNAEQK